MWKCLARSSRAYLLLPLKRGKDRLLCCPNTLVAGVSPVGPRWAVAPVGCHQSARNGPDAHHQFGYCRHERARVWAYLRCCGPRCGGSKLCLHQLGAWLQSEEGGLCRDARGGVRYRCRGSGASGDGFAIADVAFAGTAGSASVPAQPFFDYPVDGPNEGYTTVQTETFVVYGDLEGGASAAHHGSGQGAAEGYSYLIFSPPLTDD